MSHAFTLKVYGVTQQFPKDEIYGLTSQMRRATASIPTNISEGSGRTSDKEFNHFLNIALGSANETEYLLLLSHDLGYISSSVFSELNQDVNNVKGKIFRLKEKLTQQ